jgi:ABC-type transport system involved in cytochrome c biogenesis permease component
VVTFVVDFKLGLKKKNGIKNAGLFYLALFLLLFPLSIMSNSQMTPSSSNGLIDITNNDIIDLTDSPLDLSDMIKQTVQ